MTYINDKQCWEFIRSIATIERGNTEELIKGAKFVGLLRDGSTDSSVKEEELLYIQTCTEGRVTVRFAGIDAVEKADAEHITSVISGLMDSVDEEWRKKLVACATDGAAVMVGVPNGVVSRLRGD